jgi:hypothetical protein
LTGASRGIRGKGSGEKIFGRVGDVGAQRRAQPEGSGRGHPKLEFAGPDDVVVFGAKESGPEAKTGRRVAVVLVDVAEPSGSRRAVHRAVVLGVKIVEHADCEKYDERDDHGLFHEEKIIPRPADFVNGRTGRSA